MLCPSKTVYSRLRPGAMPEVPCCATDNALDTAVDMLVLFRSLHPALFAMCNALNGPLHCPTLHSLRPSHVLPLPCPALP